MSETEPGTSGSEELPGEELPDEDTVDQEDEALGAFTSDTQLSLDACEHLGDLGRLSVVLLAGEAETGKTTLLVAGWDEILANGKLDDIDFLGTRTALGFERRAWLSRLPSGATEPKTERTRVEDAGFIHLGLRKGGVRHQVLFSDVAGEVFERVRKVASFDDELEWLHRVGSTLLLVDGEAFASNRARSTALQSSRLLLRKLAASERLHRPARVAVVLAKADVVRVKDELAERWEQERETLLELARVIDPNAVVFETAARPKNGTEPTGVEDVFRWLLDDQPPVVIPESPSSATDRVARRIDA